MASRSLVNAVLLIFALSVAAAAPKPGVFDAKQFSQLPFTGMGSEPNLESRWSYEVSGFERGGVQDSELVVEFPPGTRVVDAVRHIAYDIDKSGKQVQVPLYESRTGKVSEPTPGREMSPQKSESECLQGQPGIKALGLDAVEHFRDWEDSFGASCEAVWRIGGGGRSAARWAAAKRGEAPGPAGRR